MVANEWAAQVALTRQWVDSGVVIGGDLHLLAAWEVMFPSWRINDAAKHWTEPSVDFVAVDRDGGLVAMELKPRVPGRKPAWRVLCQVTHRALLMARSFSPSKLDGAHEACWTGAHGRVSGMSGDSLETRHQALFGLREPVPLGGRPVGRAVVAASFGPKWDAVRGEFEVLTSDRLAIRLGELGELGDSAPSAARESRRLLGVMPWKRDELRSAVATVEVEWPT